MMTIRTTLLHLLLIAGSVVMIFPMVWMLFTSLKSPGEFYLYPPSLLPDHWRFANYVDAWGTGKWSLYFLNSILYSALTILGQIITSYMAAYAFARLKFKGRDALFLIILSTMMIPGQVTIISVYLLLSGIGWIDTYTGLIVPGLAGAFGIFLLRQFLLGVPVEIEEAARIDGASRVYVMVNIVAPLIFPALVSLFIFTFLGTWNEFFWPLIVTSSAEMRTVQIGLAMFRDQYGTVNLGVIMAASVIVMMPMIIVYLFAQKQFIEGIATSGLKG